ncbi:MAG: TetR family transcriptional regulator, partial [Acholeplasmataceae bacterium]|nr:TetR family transcriptional regulator [Acholeplasmataceae bacterium]
MQSTKDKILGVVIEYIKNDTSYEKITLSKVAKSANIGKSTVYEYFGSKDELIEETCRFLLMHYQAILFGTLEAATFEAAFREQIKKILLVMKDAQNIMEIILNKHHDEFF